MKNLRTIRAAGESRLAITGVMSVSIEGINMAKNITRRPPNRIASQPPGIFFIYNLTVIYLFWIHYLTIYYLSNCIAVKISC